MFFDTNHEYRYIYKPSSIDRVIYIIGGGMGANKYVYNLVVSEFKSSSFDMNAKKSNNKQKSHKNTPEDKTTDSTLVEAAKKPNLGRKLLYYGVRRMKTHYETHPSIQGSKARLRCIN